MDISADTTAGLRGHYASGRHMPAAGMRTYQILRPAETHSRPATCVEVGCRNNAAGFVVTADLAPAGGRTACGLAHPLDGPGPCATCAQVAREVRRTGRPTTALLAPLVAARVRRYTEHRDPTGVTVWTYPPGQECYEAHTVQLDRPALHLVVAGDQRGNPLGIPPRRHTRGEHWVEDFATNQDRLATEIQRG